MKHFFTLIFLLLNATGVLGQQHFNKNYRADTHNTLGTYFGSIVSTDSAYYVSGITVNTTPFFHNIALFSVLDLNGQMVHHQAFGSYPETAELWHKGLKATNDGNFVKTGLHRDGSVFLMKISPLGNPIFIQNYHVDSLGQSLTTQGGFAPTQEKGWVLALRERRDHHNVLVVLKTDSNGVEIERWEYDQPLYEQYEGDVIPDEDGGFIISSIRAKSSGNGFSVNQTHIFKIDSTGQLKWEYYTPLSKIISCENMSRADDGGIILAGATYFQQIDPNNRVYYLPTGYLLKLTHLGQFLWERELGHKNESYFTRVISRDNHFYAWGQNLNPDTTEWGAWMVKISSEWGKVDFERIISRDPFPNIWEYNFLVDVVPTQDKGFIFSGYTDVPCQFGDTCGYWGWVVKLDSLGCEDAGCYTVGLEEMPFLNSTHQVSPNPAQSYITFAYQSQPKVQSLHVYDIWGKKVFASPLPAHTDEFTLDLHAFPQGIYVYYFMEKGRIEASGKFVKK